MALGRAKVHELLEVTHLNSSMVIRNLGGLGGASIFSTDLGSFSSCFDCLACGELGMTAMTCYLLIALENILC